MMSKALILAVLTVNFLSLISGYCIAVVNRAVPYLQAEFKMSETLQRWALESLFLGTVLGSMFVARSADFRGRRPVLSAIALFFMFAIVGTSVSSDVVLFCVFRFLTGIAIGGVCVLLPVYLSELAPASVRGKVVLSFPLAVISGMVLAFLADFWLQDTGANNWRYMILCGAVPSVLFFLFRVVIPESPRFLMQKGLEQETDIVLGRIDPGCERFQFREDYKRTVNLKVLRKNSYLFKVPLIRQVFLSVLTGIFMAFAAMNLVSHFAVNLATTMGMSQGSVSWPALVIGVISLVSLLFITRKVDKIGRTRILSAGSLGLSLSLLLLALVVVTMPGLKLLHAIPMVLFFIFFTVSLGSLPWVILPEIFPGTARIRGVAYGIAAFWFFTMITSFFIPLLSGNLAYGISFACFGFLSLLGYLFFKGSMNETNGIPLEHIGKEPVPETTEPENKVQ